MGNSHEEHRPLRGGLWIRTGKTNDSGGLDVVTNGTLTGLATRTDGTKVLVTCNHVLTGGQLIRPTSDHGMYQHRVEQSTMTDPTRHKSPSHRCDQEDWHRAVRTGELFRYSHVHP